jgi:hypothetical protein
VTDLLGMPSARQTETKNIRNSCLYMVVKIKKAEIIKNNIIKKSGDTHYPFCSQP